MMLLFQELVCQPVDKHTKIPVLVKHSKSVAFIHMPISLFVFIDLYILVFAYLYIGL